MEDPVKIFALMYLLVFELLFGFALTQANTVTDAVIISVFIILAFLVIVLLSISKNE